MMGRGDIYHVDLNPTQGHEQRGARYVMIISPQEFNVRFNTPWVCSISPGRNLPRNAGFAVQLDDSTRVRGVILCNQVRAIDMRARNGKYIETPPAWIVEEVVARLQTFLQ
jgi:mRNA-degrading endonuclease toxin of MazEF toxin-antitoxin module